jgi:hypothetical protein
MRVFIGFTGVKQAGKSTAFQFIKERFPLVQEVALADKLKNECARVFNLERVNFDAPELKERELEQPVYLDETNIQELLKAFNLTYDYDKHVRPHMGTILHTPRQVAQYVGTEVLRAVDPDVHCKGPVADLPAHGVFVVTDMRFHNEYDYFAKNYESNFFPFFINNYAAEAKAAKDSHASERYIFEIAKKCERVDNNGSLEDLRRQILSAAELVVRRYEGE